MARRGKREAAPPLRRMRRRRAGESDPAELPATDEGKAAYFMIADARGQHPKSVGLETVSGRVFAGRQVCRPALDDGEIETLEILADPEAVRELQLAERDARAGRVVEWKKGGVKNTG